MIGTEYRITISDDAIEDLEKHLEYIEQQFQNYFAIVSILKDYDETIKQLSYVGGVLDYCKNLRMRKRGLRKIHFKRHRLILIYKINGAEIIVVRIVHANQDYEKLF